jgi:hypothetical protein
MGPHSADEFVEIHRTDSPTEATRLVEVVLRPQGIEAVIHDRTIHAIPAPASAPGDLFIAVPASQRDRARALLDEYLEALPD